MSVEEKVNHVKWISLFMLLLILLTVHRPVGNHQSIPASTSKNDANTEKKASYIKEPAPRAALPSVEVTATGYYAGYESTGKNPDHPKYGITFSGVKVRRDIVSTIAADPKVFPLGTILEIPGYGYGVVADTGSAIKGHTIDLYFATKDQVYALWGKKKVNVKVIKKGEGKITEIMLDHLNKVFTKPSSSLM